VKLSDEQIYCATFGAMMACQVTDNMNIGLGAPNDDEMDRYVEEANAVALMTLEATERCRMKHK
jgi:hypothetical protein